MSHSFTFIFLLSIISITANAQNGGSVDSAKLSNDSIGKDESVFQKVEIEAAFPGGEMAWRSFLVKKLNPNVPVDNGAPSGLYKVYVQFVVDKEGNINDVRALTNYGYGMEQEVMKLIKAGPKWIPAIQRGRKVNAYRRQPVTFQVVDENFEIISKESYIFRAGIENAITIKANRVKPGDLHVTISEGSIIPKGGGNYIVKVDRPGRTVIELYNANKRNKKIGAASFDVLPK
jgi:hypothetical protein